MSLLCSAADDETAGGVTGSAIYKKNVASEPAVVDTMGPVVESETVKLNDAQPETAADADKVSALCIH